MSAFAIFGSASNIRGLCMCLCPKRSRRDPLNHTQAAARVYICV